MRIQRRPAWLRKRIEFDQSRATSALLSHLRLNTVCREAKCPNLSECFKKRHAAFLILGRQCTRNCAFCNVETATPRPPDRKEPHRIAEAVRTMGLKHVVVTSVTRDDLGDGGAVVFARTVQTLRRLCPNVRVELLIPDFKNNPGSIRRVCESKPRIIGHNMETVRRLYALRPQADYQRSLDVLKSIKKTDTEITTKSALMLGLGERQSEVCETMEALRGVNCDLLALGQYLRPGLNHTPVVEYIQPLQFQKYKNIALRLGFRHVESGPYVRSSYNASSYIISSRPAGRHRKILMKLPLV